MTTDPPPEVTEPSSAPASGARHRVRVTSPRRGSSRPRALSVTAEIDSQTRVGELYVRSLMRSQMRLALTVLLGLALTVGGLPVAFGAFPSLRTATVLGIPVPWLLLGGLVYPWLVALGWLYVVQAERNETDFADLVTDPDDDGPPA